MNEKSMLSEEKRTGLHVQHAIHQLGRHDPKCPGCGARIVEYRKVIQ